MVAKVKKICGEKVGHTGTLDPEATGVLPVCIGRATKIIDYIMNSEKVYEVNALGPKYIAEACKEIGAKMVYISTDYVFDGKGAIPFETTDPKKGLSVYGKTKSQGEDFVTSMLDKYFIVRISWVFGKNGNNFVKTMI